MGDTDDNLKQTNIHKITRLTTWSTFFRTLDSSRKKKEFRDSRILSIQVHKWLLRIHDLPTLQSKPLTSVRSFSLWYT